MIPTHAGTPTRGEAYAKLIHHLIECQELAAVMSHLHNTEHSNRDQRLALYWLRVSENFKRLQYTITNLAKGYLQ